MQLQISVSSRYGDAGDDYVDDDDDDGDVGDADGDTDDGDDDDGDDDNPRARDYLSGAVTLADICLEKLPWETKCGIIQPTNSP